MKKYIYLFVIMFCFAINYSVCYASLKWPGTNWGGTAYQRGDTLAEMSKPSTKPMERVDLGDGEYEYYAYMTDRWVGLGKSIWIDFFEPRQFWHYKLKVDGVYVNDDFPGFNPQSGHEYWHTGYPGYTLMPSLVDMMDGRWTRRLSENKKVILNRSAH